MFFRIGKICFRIERLFFHIQWDFFLHQAASRTFADRRNKIDQHCVAVAFVLPLLLPLLLLPLPLLLPANFIMVLTH